MLCYVHSSLLGYALGFLNLEEDVANVEGKVTRVQVHFDENKPGYVHDCLYHEFIQAFICSLIQSLLSLTLLES